MLLQQARQKDEREAGKAGALLEVTLPGSKMKMAESVLEQIEVLTQFISSEI